MNGRTDEFTDGQQHGASPAEQGWDQQIASLLTDLSAVQTDLLALLSEKRKLIAASDGAALEALGTGEAKLTERLMQCHHRRQQLLANAQEQGKPSDSLQSLTASLPRAQRNRLRPEVNSARQQAKLLQHQSLTNWVLVQRTLLHLSQMIEIIASGGQMKPTYGRDANARGGNLVDQAG